MQELLQIVRQHPESVAFVFKEYGHEKLPVNIVSLQAMAVKYGAEFIEDLAAHMARESEVSGFTGVMAASKLINPALLGSWGASMDTTIKPVSATLTTRIPTVAAPIVNPSVLEEKKGKWRGILEKGLELFLGFKNQQQQQQQQQQQEQQQQQQQEKRKSSTALIIGVAVVAVLVVALLLFNKKTTVK